MCNRGAVSIERRLHMRKKADDPTVVALALSMILLYGRCSVSQRCRLPQMFQQLFDAWSWIEF